MNNYSEQTRISECVRKKRVLFRFPTNATLKILSSTLELRHSKIQFDFPLRSETSLIAVSRSCKYQVIESGFANFTPQKQKTMCGFDITYFFITFNSKLKTSKGDNMQ